MNHDSYRESIKEYRSKSNHDIHYYDAGHVKQQPKVPRNKNPNKIFDGSETFSVNARHR